VRLISSIISIFFSMTLLWSNVSHANVSIPNTALKFKGDVRVRAEADARTGTGVVDGNSHRTRFRHRARFGLVFSPKDSWFDFGIRLATNIGTPGNSPHQTSTLNIRDSSGTPVADNKGESLNLFQLDRAYVRFKTGDWGKITLGKQAYPHWSQTEILHDLDIQPEGISATVEYALGDTGKLHASASHFYISNVNWSENFLDNDVSLGWQVRYSGNLLGLDSTFAVTGQHMRDAGETANETQNHIFRHTNFVSGGIQVKTRELPVKFTAGLDIVKSDAKPVGTEIDHTLGWVTQARVGYQKYGLRYYLYNIQEASVPFWGPVSLTQDNFPASRSGLWSGGSTGIDGHRIQFDYSATSWFSADARLYLVKGKSENTLSFSEVPDRSITRFQINLNGKF
jgi:hypothetical protein